MKPYVQALGVDKSLLDAMPTVFGREPAERGSFDSMLIDQLENSLSKHLESLGQQREAAEAAVVEKAAKVEEMGAAVKAAEEKQQASRDTLASTDQERAQLTAALAEASKAVSDHDKTTKQASADHTCHASGLQRLQAVRDALTSLQEREVEVKVEAEVEAEAAQPEPQTQGVEPSKMEVDASQPQPKSSIPQTLPAVEVGKTVVATPPAAATMIAAGA